MKIVSKAAEDKKVADSDEFKRRLAFARNRLLMDQLLAQEGKAATTDAAEKKIYDDAVKKSPPRRKSTLATSLSRPRPTPRRL